MGNVTDCWVGRKSTAMDYCEFRGIPIIALLYIIFAGGFTADYKEDVGKKKVGGIKLIIKHLNIGYKWAE